MNSFNILNLNWVDYSIVAIVVISAVISLIRGFVRESISLASWILAIIVAIKFSTMLAVYLKDYIETPSLRVGIAFLVLFFIVLLIGALINFLVSNLVSKTGLSGTDRLVGLAFGIARGVLFIGVLVMIMNMTKIPENPWWKDSQIIPQFQGMATWLKGFVPEQMQKIKADTELTNDQNDQIDEQKTDQNNNDTNKNAATTVN